VLLKDPNDNLVAICSGAFLTRSQVVTAGHCVAELGGIAAKVDIESGGESAHGLNIRIHPKFQLESNQLSPFDIALIETSKPLNVTTLPLLLSEPVAVGQTFHAFGYGKDEQGHSALDQDADDSLKKADMRVISLQDGFIVSSFNATQESACAGDSGGPAIIVNKDNIPGIVGLVNGGSNNVCLAGTTAVFTNVQNDEIRDFITQYVPSVGAI
jgi:secreted trypsin-like serine protease